MRYYCCPYSIFYKLNIDPLSLSLTLFLPLSMQFNLHFLPSFLQSSSSLHTFLNSYSYSHSFLCFDLGLFGVRAYNSILPVLQFILFTCLPHSIPLLFVSSPPLLSLLLLLLLLLLSSCDRVPTNECVWLAVRSWDQYAGWRSFSTSHSRLLNVFQREREGEGERGG